MSLGETIDREIGGHLRTSPGCNNPNGVTCPFCSALSRIRTAYEEMIQSLNVLSGPTGIKPSIEAQRTFNRAHSANYQAVLNSLVSPTLKPAEDETYESVLVRDPDFEKEEAA